MRNFNIRDENGAKLIVTAENRTAALRWLNVIATERYVRSVVRLLAHVYNA